MNTLLSLLSFKKKSNSEKIILISKISILSFLAVYFLSNFSPYFEGQDSYLYGLGSIGLSEGTFEKSNLLLSETGKYEFVPRQWVITESNTFVPSTSIGLMTIGSIFYSLFGHYGLFYLGPLSALSLLIISERVSTKLFGSVAGLVSLVLISTNLFIVRTGTDLLTGNISTIFLIIGFYFLFKFLKSPSGWSALILSSTLAFSAVIRISGLVFFPIEFILIIGFFIIRTYQTKHESKFFSKIRSSISTRSFYYLLILSIPWIAFFAFQFSYNDYFFGDPLTKYVDVRIKMDSSISHNTEFSSILGSENNILEKAEILSQYLLPYPFSGARDIESSFEDQLGKNWLGIPPIIFLGIVILLSFLKKINRTDFLITIVFSLSLIMFYSLVVGNIDPDRGVSGRYMIPSSVFSAFLFGIILQKFSILKISSSRTKYIKFLIIALSIIFFIYAMNYVTPITDWINSDSKITNPIIHAERYPLDKEGLNDESIILNTMGNWVVDYDVIALHPFLGFSLKGEINETEFPERPILILLDLLETNHSVYTFKESSHIIEKKYLNYLVTNYDLILKEHSESFCKFELSSEQNVQSDQICLKN